MRWLQQRDCYSCGPVALYNALRWQGTKVSPADLKKFKRLLKCRAPAGTPLPNWTRGISRYGFPRIRYLDLTKLQCELLRGNGLLINSANPWNAFHRHYYFVPCGNLSRVFCVNIDGGHKWLMWSQFQKWMFATPLAWRVPKCTLT